MLEGPDLLVILGVMVLFFGSAKIPQLARSLGRAKGEFERGARDVQRELEEAAKPSQREAERDDRPRDPKTERA